MESPKRVETIRTRVGPQWISFAEGMEFIKKTVCTHKGIM